MRVQREQGADQMQPSTTDGELPRLKILHLIVNVGHANAQFNEHCLPVRTKRDLTICSLHPRTVEVPPEIRLFEGDGTARGFMRALRAALEAGPFDVVHAHAPGTAALLLLTNLRMRGSMANGVVTVHNSRPSFPLRNQLLLAPLFAAFPTVVFCSEAAAASFPAAMRSLARDRRVVQNGVDTERVDRAIQGLAPPSTDGLRVAAVGRLIPRKDPLTLLAAFGAASDAPDTLRFIGDGAQRTDVLGGAARAGIADRVSVSGVLARDEVYQEVARSSLFVSASRGEGLPVSVLEAMTCGVPVVLSDIPSHREVAASADFVPLVAPGDTPALASAIGRFKAMEPSERAAIGSRCRELAVARFGLAQMQRSYERVYRSVLTRTSGRTPTATVGRGVA
jgi:glycosyltransferase involved in cell wall biosynthesis